MKDFDNIGVYLIAQILDAEHLTRFERPSTISSRVVRAIGPFAYQGRAARDRILGPFSVPSLAVSRDGRRDWFASSPSTRRRRRTGACRGIRIAPSQSRGAWM